MDGLQVLTEKLQPSKLRQMLLQLLTEKLQVFCSYISMSLHESPIWPG